MECIKAGLDMKYWRDKLGREMDFVVCDDTKILGALECKKGDSKTESFHTFVRKYEKIPARIVTEDSVFKSVDILKGI